MRALPLLLLMWTGAVAADDASRAVLVLFASSRPAQATGDVVAKADITELLFTSEPCPLPINGGETMHRAWSVPGIVGCWYETVGGAYVFVSPIFTRIGQSHVSAIPRALLHPDGTATITEPDYSVAWIVYREAEWARKQVRQSSGQAP